MSHNPHLPFFRYFITAATILLFSDFVSPAQSQVAQSQPAQSQPPEITLTQTETTVNVKIGGELFTQFHHQHASKPILYPIYGPGQISMTRNWPMKDDVAGEAHDHPHHKSLWFSHEINGIDFWAERGGVVKVTDLKLIPEQNQIVAKSAWIQHAKKPNSSKTIFTDTMTWKFGADENSRWIDATIDLHASEGDVRFDDTKEGTFALRTHPDLRLTANPKEGVKLVFGSALNSNGETDKNIWAKPAKWVLYQGPIGGTPMSIAIFDHPKNLRHPTTWHARDYGLVAANPFGLHHFTGAKKGAGAYTIKAGETLTLRYRAVFIQGIATAAEVEEKFAQFAE